MAMQLFLNAWRELGSLSVAFGALNTFIFLTLYIPVSTKDAAINGDVPKYAVVDFIEVRLVPRRWVGFGIVMGIFGMPCRTLGCGCEEVCTAGGV